MWYPNVMCGEESGPWEADSSIHWESPSRFMFECEQTEAKVTVLEVEKYEGILEPICAESL